MNFFRISKITSSNKSLFFLPRNFLNTKDRKYSENSLVQKINTLDTDTKAKALHIKIPQTKFNPRFHAKTSEIQYHPMISEDLYRWQDEFRSDSNQFILHEAPISLHEELHLGHFFNKSIKDIILRKKLMQGFKINSVMGFNCHGPVIENAAIRKYVQEVERGNIGSNEIREICKKYVAERFDDYVKRIKRWGIMTDISKAYLTLNPLYEASVLEIFQQLYEKSVLFQQWKPLHWSIITKKPVFEDELMHDFVPKKGYFVKFPVIDYGPDDYLRTNCPKLSLLAFCPEPWTLTATQALGINSQFTYCIFQKKEEFYLLHEQAFLRNKTYFKEQGFQFVMKSFGKTLNGLKVKDPLFDKSIDIIMTSDIKASIGSAIRPICPAHYLEDYKYSQDHKLSRQGYVDENGNLNNLALENLNGKNVVLDDANKAILIMLGEQNKMLDGLIETANVSFFMHKETKEQIIIRSIPHWFCRIDGEDKKEYLEELKDLKIHDFSDENSYFPKFFQVLEEIDADWCISLQGNWGIPLPIFYYKGTNQIKSFLKSDILSHIIRNIRLHGSEIWWKWSIEDLLPKKYKHMAKELEKSTEVLDIWFEVGCSQYAILEKGIENQPLQITGNTSQKEVVIQKNDDNMKKPINPDLIIEGKDQCECWLMGLALVNISTTNLSFIKAIKHHTLIKDLTLEPTANIEKLNKYSDIKANLDDIIEGSIKFNGERQYGLGVDVIRWWVASRDNPLKPEITSITPQDIDHMNSEINLIRKCFREILMHLNHEFPKQYYIDIYDLPFLHDFIYTQLTLFIYNVNKAYEQYDISKVYRLIMEFVKIYVWDIYIQGTKGFLISNPLDQEAFTIVYMYTRICENLLIVLAPILCHNAQNIYDYFNRNKEKNVFHNKWPEVSKVQIEKVINRIPDYSILMGLRTKIMNETVKNLSRIQKDFQKVSKEFELVLICDENSAERKFLKILGKDGNRFFGVQKFTLENQNDNEYREVKVIASFKYLENRKDNKDLEFNIKIYPVQANKCYRCFKSQSKKTGELCNQCVEYLQKHQLKLPDMHAL